MRFLVDAQLPRRLTHWLQAEGHEAIGNCWQEKQGDPIPPPCPPDKGVSRGNAEGGLPPGVPGGMV